ncbi:MAG: class I SAM-dependent methyltransferase [Candidatus Bathyarchaeia archaeon]
MIRSSNKGFLVADIDCSTGTLTKVFSLISGTFGLDLDKNKLRYAKRLYPSLDFICADIHHLPLKDNSVDLVICSSVLEFIRNLETGVKEIKRILRTRGTIVAGYPHDYVDGYVTYCGCTPAEDLIVKIYRIPLYPSPGPDQLVGTDTTGSNGYYRIDFYLPYWEEEYRIELWSSDGTTLLDQTTILWGMGVTHYEIDFKLPGVCGEGFTPGFWKNHLELWVTYTPSMLWTDVFKDPISIRIGKTVISNPTLRLAIMATGGINEKKGVYDALARHAVAALLNAAHPDVDYPMTEAEIISAVNEVIGNADYTDAETLKNS